MLVLLVGAGIVVYKFFGSTLGRVFQAKAKKMDIPELWANGRYDEVLSESDILLQKNPMDATALIFSGFAFFYKGISQANLEEKLPLIDKAVISLRKANLLDGISLRAEIYYVLGKAYFHKGKFYSDLAIENLLKALESGYTASDIYEYLGLAFSQIENYPESVKYFLLAVEKNPSDLLFLTLAQTYFQMRNMNQAEEYLLKTLNRTKDSAVEEKTRFLLGEIYMEKKENLKAEEQYRKILEINPQNANAHFYAGEIYNTMGDSVKARAEWRMALKIDPSHYGARLRLYN